MSEHISAVSADDYAEWLPLWKAYQAFYNTEISEETSQVVWSRFLDTSEPMHAALLRREGKAVGMVHWIYHRSCWTTGDYCYLQDLFVAEAGRKTGAGTALIHHVYDDAKRQGASRVYWLTHKTNEAGISLYRKVADESGFIQFRHMVAS